MDESEDTMSSDDTKNVNYSSAVKVKPKKRSLVERELETSLTARVTSPITMGDNTTTSRYGRARRLKTDSDFCDTEKAVMSVLKSPQHEKIPVKPQSPVYRMYASNSPVKLGSPKREAIEGNLDNQIENIYNANISLSRFGSEEKSSTLPSPAKKYTKLYIRKDLIQTKEKEENIPLIKNLFSPVKSSYKPTNSHLSNILERSSEKYNLNGNVSQNGYLDKTSVVKTLDFDENKKKHKDNREMKKTVLSKSELFELEAKCEYQVGDLAWARMGTYPFWPSIVTREPVSDMFVKKKLFGRIERDVIHVTFFGDNGRRSWIVDSMLRKFQGKAEFMAAREQFTPEDKKKEGKLYTAFFISEKKQALWNLSVEEAETLMREPKRLRIEMLQDMLGKIRTTKVTPKGQKSGKIVRADSDVSLSESLYDTLFSEDDGKKDDSERSKSKTRNKSLDVSDVVTACLDNMAAKTGITKIQRQSHMDRWLQKAKSKTPEKSQIKVSITVERLEKEAKDNNSKESDKELGIESKVNDKTKEKFGKGNDFKKKKKLSLNKTPPKKPYSLRKSTNESQNLLSHHNEHDYSKYVEINGISLKTNENVDGNQSTICIIEKIESLSDKIDKTSDKETLASLTEIASVDSSTVTENKAKETGTITVIDQSDTLTMSDTKSPAELESDLLKTLHVTHDEDTISKPKQTEINILPSIEMDVDLSNVQSVDKADHTNPSNNVKDDNAKDDEIKNGNTEKVDLAIKEDNLVPTTTQIVAPEEPNKSDNNKMDVSSDSSRLTSVTEESPINDDNKATYDKNVPECGMSLDENLIDNKMYDITTQIVAPEEPNESDNNKMDVSSDSSRLTSVTEESPINDDNKATYDKNVPECGMSLDENLIDNKIYDIPSTSMHVVDQPMEIQKSEKVIRNKTNRVTTRSCSRNKSNENIRVEKTTKDTDLKTPISKKVFKEDSIESAIAEPNIVNGFHDSEDLSPASDSQSDKNPVLIDRPNKTSKSLSEGSVVSHYFLQKIKQELLLDSDNESTNSDISTKKVIMHPTILEESAIVETTLKDISKTQKETEIKNTGSNQNVKSIMDNSKETIDKDVSMNVKVAKLMLECKVILTKDIIPIIKGDKSELVEEKITPENTEKDSKVNEIIEPIVENGIDVSKDPTQERVIKEEVDPDVISINSVESTASITKRRSRKEKVAYDSADKSKDPEFLKYLELRQDALIDEHPELTEEEITAYLYKTWLYEENLKSDSKKTDEAEQVNLVKGLNQEVKPKRAKKKTKVKKLIDIGRVLNKQAPETTVVDLDDDDIVRDKPKRKTQPLCYTEDFSDIEDEIEIFEIFKNKRKNKVSDINTQIKTEEIKTEIVVNNTESPETSDVKPDSSDLKPETSDVKPEIKSENQQPVIDEQEIVIEDEYDEVEAYFEELTQPKPNIFKGLIREKVCEVCERTSNLVKCKGCNGMFHVDCGTKEAEVVEVAAPVRGRKKKKKFRGRRPKDSTDSNGLDSESQSDERSQDANVSEEMNVSVEDIEPETITVDDVDNFEAQLAAKMKEMLETTNDVQYDSYSSDDGLDWENAVAGKCEIVDIKLKPKTQPTIPDFKCKNCVKHDMPLCFVCKSEVSPKQQMQHRQRCQVAHCHKYYHLECLEQWPQTQFNSGEPSRSNKKINEHFEALTCPRHVCHTCVCDDPRGCKTRFSGDKLARCVRCPATYHSFTKCLPAGTQILTASHIICPRHYKHRQGKAPCHVNTGWCFICALGGTLICCEYCPTSFHAECLNIKPPEGGYMCEDCETGRLPLYGEMVWVKLGHYRWWPGIVLHPSEIPDNILSVKHSPGEFVVRFFGQYDHYWVNRGRVFPFQEGDSGRISSQKSKIDEAFTIAMEHAQRAFEILKNIEPNEEEDLDIASSLLPPHYVKLKVNKPCGSLYGKKIDVEESSLTQCECNPDEEEPCGPYSHCLNRMLLTECGPICRAGERCNNRAFEKRQYPKLVPYRTPHRGWGLKTLEDVKAGQFVIEYVGELIDEEEFRRRMNRKHEIRDENFYFLTLDKERMIDAGPKGNLARFMNHCCEPNCETQKWTVLGDVRVGLFALRDIPANSEVTFNYNLECAGIDKKRCLCGAKRCSGYIGAKLKQEEPQAKKTKVALKRTYKKRKNIEESPSTSKSKPKRPVGRPPKPRELTEIEKDLLIIKNATNGLSSDSESSERLSSIESEKKDTKALKRKRVSFSTEEVLLNLDTASPSVKRIKLDDEKSSEVGD